MVLFGPRAIIEELEPREERKDGEPYFTPKRVAKGKVLLVGTEAVKLKAGDIVWYGGVTQGSFLVDFEGRRASVHHSSDIYAKEGDDAVS